MATCMVNCDTPNEVQSGLTDVKEKSNDPKDYTPQKEEKRENFEAEKEREMCLAAGHFLSNILQKSFSDLDDDRNKKQKCPDCLFQKVMEVSDTTREKGKIERRKGEREEKEEVGQNIQKTQEKKSPEDKSDREGAAKDDRGEERENAERHVKEFVIGELASVIESITQRARFLSGRNDVITRPATVIKSQETNKKTGIKVTSHSFKTKVASIPLEARVASHYQKVKATTQGSKVKVSSARSDITKYRPDVWVRRSLDNFATHFVNQILSAALEQERQERLSTQGNRESIIHSQNRPINFHPGQNQRRLNRKDDLEIMKAINWVEKEEPAPAEKKVKKSRTRRFLNSVSRSLARFGRRMLPCIGH